MHTTPKTKPEFSGPKLHIRSNHLNSRKIRMKHSWLCSAMVERLTPDQKVTYSNHVRVNHYFGITYAILKYDNVIIYHNPTYLIGSYVCIPYCWS